ncbi:hypothetical protein [uncultured Paraglaciecola sp.]|uniref:phage adaptor protein n=1 Tax=uncultured Paraglaciecola sp. TaxID=1765024 RepID=UPI0026307F31|nr:hypothetical protein [uncultured Paraglaciecola sp.]
MEVTKIFKSVRANLRQRGKTGNFTPDALVTYLNDCLLEVSDELQFFKKKIDLNPDPDGRIYLPDDQLRLIRVSVNGFELPPLSPRFAQLAQGETVGGSYGYIVVNGYIQVIPKYQQPITLMYIAKPADVDNEDQTLDVPASYRMAIVNWITFKCFLELGKVAQSEKYEMLYMKEADKRRKQIRQQAWTNARAPYMPNPYQ